MKFGLNPYTQSFTCDSCHQKFLNTPRSSLFARVEINGEVFDFAICSTCSAKGLLNIPTSHLDALEVAWGNRENYPTQLKGIPLQLKFGYALNDQTHTCSFCRSEFQAAQRAFLFLQLTIDDNVMGFSICPKCGGKGLFETMGYQSPKTNSSYPIGFA